MKITLHGASGRMGTALVSVIRNTSDTIVGAVAKPGCDAIGRDLGEVVGLGNYGVEVQADLSSALLGCDVLIDFSHASAVESVAAAAARAGVSLVSGTTGLSEASHEALKKAATRVPVVWAPNYAIGIQVLAELVRHATARLGLGFDVEVVEVHHRGKADAPSGTALRLAQEAQAVRDLRLLHGREGMVGRRSDDEMAVLAVRGGDVVGDHTVYLLGQGERLELTHRATSREVLARGALFAARALRDRKPALYSLAHLLPSI